MLDDQLGPPAGFLGPAPDSAGARALYDGDLSGLGYVMNLSRLWAHLPSAQPALSALLDQAVDAAGLTYRQRGVLIAAAASTLGDSYCSLAWGSRLAGAAGEEVAGSVLRGGDAGLDPREQALARWARLVVADPSGTAPEDVAELRAAGFDDQQVFAVTLFVALRVAFSSVNGALGAPPDAEVHAAAPQTVLEAVDFGRPAVGSPRPGDAP